MAWTTVECAYCRENFDVQMYGPHKDRERKVEFVTWECDSCKEENQEKRADENCAAGFPELSGSEKQIIWAESVRQEKILEIEQYFEKKTIKKGKEDRVKEVLARIKNEKSAKAWIDNRDQPPNPLVCFYNALLDSENNENGFVEMKGTEKQLAWANTLRVKTLQEVGLFLVGTNFSAEHFKQILDAVKKIENAEFWINNREETVRGIIIKLGFGIK